MASAISPRRRRSPASKKRWSVSAANCKRGLERAEPRVESAALALRLAEQCERLGSG